MHACTLLHDYRDIIKVIQMKFKQILGFKFAANLTLGIILFGSIIFTLGFGASLLIARQEVSKEVNGKVESQINYLESFVEGQLMRIEDAGYSLGGSLFGKAVRGKGTDGFIELDELALAVFEEFVIERGVSAAARFERVEEIIDDLVQGHIVVQLHTALV